MANPHRSDVAPPEAPDERLGPSLAMAGTLRKVRSRFLASLFVLYALGAGAGIGTVLMHPVRDWFLFIAMYLVVLAYMGAYVKAHLRRRPIYKALGLLATEALLVFFCYILADRIPARKVFVEGQVIVREEMPALWVSVALLGLVGVGLLLHFVWLGRIGVEAEQEPARDPPAAGDAGSEPPPVSGGDA